MIIFGPSLRKNSGQKMCCSGVLEDYRSQHIYVSNVASLALRATNK